MNTAQQKEIYIGGEKFTASHAVVQNETSKNFGRAYWFVRDAEGKFIYFHWDQHSPSIVAKPIKSLKRTISACLEKILKHHSEKEEDEDDEDDSSSDEEEDKKECPVLKKLKTTPQEDIIVQKLLDLVDGLQSQPENKTKK